MELCFGEDAAEAEDEELLGMKAYRRNCQRIMFVRWVRLIGCSVRYVCRTDVLRTISVTLEWSASRERDRKIPILLLWEH